VRQHPIAGVRPHPALPLFRAALALSLILSALLFFLWSWRWPLVGDASLMHYIAFLIERGWAPYRDLGDMNMPGSYLIELAAMYIFGMGDLAWRIFDFTLLAIASASFFAICRPSPAPTSGGPSFPASPEGVGSYKGPGAPFIAALSRNGVGWLACGRLAALFSASLFILIHGRDGLAEGGQRDLTMGVCLIAATAFLFLAVRYTLSDASALAFPSRWAGRREGWFAWVFGLFSGLAFTIKPTTLPLTVAQLALALYFLRRQQRPTNNQQRLLAPAIAGYLIAPAIALVFLLREQALSAFLAGFGRDGAVTYYATLGHRPLGYILLHSISPLLPLVILWLAIVALNRFVHAPRAAFDWERAALLAGVLFGLANCILQARALPYYRYPLLVFLLPLMALEFTRASQFPNPGAPFIAASSRWVGSTRTLLTLIALAVGGFFLAPQSAILIHRYRWWETDFITTLEANLDILGGPQLSHHILCIDTNSGCGNVLYRMRLEPADGMLSDFFLFGRSNAPILLRTRRQLLDDFAVNPPRVLVVTSHLYLDDVEDYGKLARWPAFTRLLAERYTLQTQWSPARTARWWSREETPVSYRIYVLHP